MHAHDYEIAHHEGVHHDHAADVASLGGARALKVLLETARCGGRHHLVCPGHAGGHDHLGRPTKNDDQIGLDVRLRSAPRQQ